MGFEYIVFHKPFQVLTQFTSDGDKSTLSDYLKNISKDIYPVGRLDYDSEGILILTNDKALTHELTDPKFAHKKTYWVQVDGDITDDAIKQLRKGVTISVNGKKHTSLPAAVSKFTTPPDVHDRNPPIRYRANIPTSWISLTITEGKNRQVRKMTAAVGFPTLRLIRFSVDKVDIEGLKPGEFVHFDERIKNHLIVKK